MNILRAWLGDWLPQNTTSELGDALTLPDWLERGGEGFPGRGVESVWRAIEDPATGPTLQSSFLEVLGSVEWVNVQSRAVPSRLGPPGRWVSTIDTLDNGAVTFPDDASPEPHVSLFVSDNVGMRTLSLSFTEGYALSELSVTQVSGCPIPRRLQCEPGDCACVLAKREIEPYGFFCECSI